MDRRYDVKSIAGELVALGRDGAWKSKSAGGGWSCITLRGRDGEDDPHLHADTLGSLAAERYEYTSAGRACPAIRSVLEGLGTDVFLVRCLKLRPGELVKYHTDDVVFRDTNRIVRLHLPVVTHRDAVIRFGSPLRKPAPGHMIWDARKEWESHLPAGELWFTNVNSLHSVYNGSTQDRIHLVIDVKPQPGLAKALGEWSQQN